MLRIRVCLILVAAFFLGPNFYLAQENHDFNGSKHRVGFIVGFGGQTMGHFLTGLNQNETGVLRTFLAARGVNPEEKGLGVEYDYQVKFFQAQYFLGFVRRPSWGLDILVQPQFNTTRFKPIENGLFHRDGFEFGVNAGILIRKTFFNDFLGVYAFISAGPQYVSETPDRQARGFIFSDNIFTGLNIRIFRDAYLDIRPGLRHLSNAGLQAPNRGINKMILSGGLLLNL